MCLVLLGSCGSLRHGIEHSLADAIAQRLDDTERYTARVLAAGVAAAVRVALEQWLQPVPGSPATGGLVVVSGSLPDQLRAALDTAEGRPQGHHYW